jgi:hypothetical protein
MPRCLSDRLFSRYRRHSQTDRRANRTVRFNPHVQCRTIPGRSHVQGIESTLRGRPSTRRPGDIPHPGRASRNSSHYASENPFALSQGFPMHDPQTFIRGSRKPPTPWARQTALQRGSPCRQTMTTPQPRTTQVNQDATPNLYNPRAFTPQVTPFQPPFVSATHQQINPVQPSRLRTRPVAVSFTLQNADCSTPHATCSWTPPVAVASTPQTNVDNTPQVTYSWTASITQPQNHPPPKFWTPPGCSTYSQRSVLVPSSPQPPLYERSQAEISVVSKTGATSVPASWGSPGSLGGPQVPIVQHEPARAVPLVFPSGSFINRGGRVPPFAPPVQNRVPHRRHRSRTFSPAAERVNGFYNTLSGDQINTLLTNGQLKWDVRLFPEMSTFSPARPYATNLDLPALSNEITTALIQFENRRLREFNTQWGPIRVQSGSVSTNNSATFISIRDIMEAINKYVMKPITTQDKGLFILDRQRDEAFNVMFTTRTSIQGRLNDRPRRADLLLGNLVNFRRIDVENVSDGMACLRLVLY